MLEAPAPLPWGLSRVPPRPPPPPLPPLPMMNLPLPPLPPPAPPPPAPAEVFTVASAPGAPLKPVPPTPPGMPFDGPPLPPSAIAGTDARVIQLANKRVTDALPPSRGSFFLLIGDPKIAPQLGDNLS